MRAERIFLPTRAPPRSLCWSGDALIDWVSGGTRHHLDGSTQNSGVFFAYRFDGAVMSPDGRYAVLYEVLGTKGLLLREGKVLRELHRSFYHADVYEYPIALYTFPSGRTILAHCPDEYCRLELEDAETGERLTRRESQSPDVFHSRLQFSPDGRYLLSAGWVWQPVDVACVYDVAHALEHPESLDGPGLLKLENWGPEIHGATFGENDTLFLHSSDPFADDAPSHKTAQGGKAESLGVYSLTEHRLLSEAPLEEPAGTLMAMGPHLLDFYGHPKLIEPSTGRVLERWPELATGTQSTSIIHHISRPPPIARDAAGRRFAVGTEKGIEVIRFVD
jgi:hypothetical protein